MTVGELLRQLAIHGVDPEFLLVANVGGIGREIEGIAVVREGSEPRVIVMVGEQK